MMPARYIEWFEKMQKNGWKGTNVDPKNIGLEQKIYDIAKEAENARKKLASHAAGHLRDMQDLHDRMSNVDVDPAINLYGEDQKADEINRYTVQFHCYLRCFRMFIEMVDTNE